MTQPQGSSLKKSSKKSSIFFKVKTFFDQFKIDCFYIPLDPYSKKPSIKSWIDYDSSTFSWPRYPEHNVGIIPGRSSLLIVDCDTEETVQFFKTLAQKINLSLDTLIVRTRRGVHFYYYCTFSEQLEKKQFFDASKNIKIDLLAGCKCQVVTPFCRLKINQNGEVLDPRAEDYILFEYTPIHTPEKLQELTKEQYEKLISELKKTFKKTQKEHISKKESLALPQDLTQERALTDEEIQKIAEVVAEYFQEGIRQDLVLYLSGYLRKELKIDEESVIKLYEYFIPEDDKHDVKYRYEAIRRTFSKNTKVISGWTKLAEKLGEEKATQLCNRIKQILNIPIEKPKKEEELHDDFFDLLGSPAIEEEPEKEPEKVLYIEISPKSKKFARCNFDNLCIEYGQFRKDERTEQYYYEVHHIVLDCCIDKIYVVENPLTKEKRYEMHFISKNPAEKTTILKGTLAEIWEELKSKTSYVLNPSVALPILTATFSYWLKKGWFEQKQEDLPKGFYFIDGEIVAQAWEEKEHSKKDLQKAALFLNDYIYSHPNPQLIASIVKAGLLLPFSFAQKQAVLSGALRKKMKYLFLTGQSKSGKTTTAMMLSKIWGTENKISFSSFNTEARAGKHLSTSTHILIVDEVSKDIETSSVKELIKFAQEDLMARIIQSRTLKQIHYPALGAIVMTSNSHFPEDPALLQRFLVFRFGKFDKISNEDRAKYEKEDFNCLQPLGMFTYQYVKQHGLRDNYIVYATEILKAFYETAEVEAEWLKWAFIHNTEETEEEQEYNQASSFYNAVIKFFNQNVKPKEDMDFARSIYYTLKEPKFGRWIWVDDKDLVYISKDFLGELKKFYRCQIKDLEELSEITGWEKKQKRYKDTKIYVVCTTVMEFFFRLNYIPRMLNTYEFKDWLNKRLEVKPEDDIETDNKDNDIPF